MSSGDAPVAQETPESPVTEIDPRWCKGSCNRLFLESGKGRPRDGDPVLCSRCTNRLRTELSGIDTAAAILAAGNDGMRGSTGGDSAIRMHRGGSSKRSPSPSHDTLGELEEFLRQWITVKRPVAARLGYLARPVTEQCSWLIANLRAYAEDRSAAYPDTADERCVAEVFFQQITSWHSRLTKMTKTGPALITKPVPCPRCEQMGLVQERGSDHVICSSCNRHMSVSEYEKHAAAMADHEDQKKEAAAAARAAAAKRRRSA